jgi:hypothetical protein
MLRPVDPPRPEGESGSSAVARPGSVDHEWADGSGLISVVELARAPRDIVYSALESLRHHQDWAGERHRPTVQQVVSLRGPDKLAVGDRFTTIQSTKLGHWSDQSLVVLASRPELLGFDTRGTHYLHDGRRNARGRWQHRYRLEVSGPKNTLINYSCRWTLTEGTIDVYGAVIIANTVHRGVLNLVALSEELAAAPAVKRA